MMENKVSIIYYLQYLSQLVFEVTDGCNLNCKYCSYSSMYERYDNREFKKLSFKVAKTTIDYVMNIRDSSLDVNYPLTVSFYGGEPLLNSSLVENVINCISDTYPKQKVNYAMTTNAMLLNKPLKFIVSNKFKLTISLDGDEKGQGYRVDYSGKNSFKRVISNIILLKKIYPEYFDANVMFNSVMHNKNSAESTFSFIHKNFNKTPLMSSLNPVGVRKEKIGEFKSITKTFTKVF